MIDTVKWFIKPSKNGAYVQQMQPSEYEIDLEDLDADSYRSITTGNLIDSVISKNWSKCKFTFESKTFAQVQDLLGKLSNNPIYAKIENPVFPSGFLEAEFRCSKKSLSKSLTNSNRYTLSCNLVQKKIVNGQ